MTLIKKPKTNRQKVEKRSKIQLTDLRIRLISALILFIIFGGYFSIAIISTQAKPWNLAINLVATNHVFFFLSAALLGVMIYEMTRAWGIQKWWQIAALITLSVVFYLFPFFTNNLQLPIYHTWKIENWFHWWQTLVLLFVVGGGFVFIFWQDQKINSWFQGLKVFVICFIIILGMKGFTTLSLAMIVDEAKYGFVSVLWIWGTIIATDSIAYFFGSRYGKTPIAPKISPKKSQEGAIGGTLGATVLGSLFSILIFYLIPNHDYGPFEIPFRNLANNLGVAIPGIFLFLLTFVVSVLGQMGDLFFSLIKRTVGIKDYSHLIPGHGGILDRLDSFIFTFFFIFIITLFI